MKGVPMLKVCAGLALVLAGAGGLSGCGGDAAGTSQPPSTSATSPPPSSTSAPPSSASASSSATLGPGAPGVPANARANTEAAAIAFVKYYEKVSGDLRVHPKTGVFPTMSLPSCKTCVQLEDLMKKMVRKGHHYPHPPSRVTKVERLLPTEGMWIWVWWDQVIPTDTLDASNNVVEADNGSEGTKNLAFVYDVKWTAGGWKIATIKSDDSKAVDPK